MTDPALARRIERTAWSTVLLGGLCVVLAGIQAVSPYLLRRLDALLDTTDDPMRSARQAFTSGAALSAWVNAAFGVALIVIGIAVWRRMRWSHRALVVVCWSSILVLALLAKPTLAPFFALGGGASGGWGIPVVGVVLLVAQIGAVLWFLRFWLKPEVREAFGRGAR